MAPSLKRKPPLIHDSPAAFLDFYDFATNAAIKASD
jgi:hypothetical protein